MKLIKMLNLFQPFTRQNTLFFQKKKNAQNQRAKLIFSKWAKIPLYNFGLFQQVFENLKLNKLAKEERRLDLEDRIWRLEFGKTQFSSFEAAIWRMNFKACTFERLALIFGFGRGAQVGKTSLLEVNLYGASVDVGRIHFLFGTLQALGSHQNPRYWKKT